MAARYTALGIMHTVVVNIGYTLGVVQIGERLKAAKRDYEARYGKEAG